MTLEELQARKTLYLAAEAAVLTGQEYQIRDGIIDRRMRRADLSEIRAELNKIDQLLTTLQNQSAGVRRPLYLR
jgi:hypothetical protein